MRRTLGIIARIFAIALVVGWISLVLTDFFRFQKNLPMLVVLKEETLNYDDGHVYVYYGLGYKGIVYERTSIYGSEFGHLFIKVREEIPK